MTDAASTHAKEPEAKSTETEEKPKSRELWENTINEIIDKIKCGLRFKNHAGKEVNLRDVDKKILNSAVHFFEIVRGLAACDPTGHGRMSRGIILFAYRTSVSNARIIVSLGLTEYTKSF
ncbi:hypothetical protein ASPWEDRAFT_24245 [Aspergillus wentii DTO 134E9]|uniref:Uncharacterized protein n=1 Tax=Aspergillus wentii DTO 134E9 TaxID=1073089 RepID=A0A1L9RTP5_ASPWE|nr:uncharacterized protein ASPWEDRAFT_24245 [Aspergillus wentii DTO 134E9]OJJ38299.1 hypothetical protein ASPWEDRAFT_24245 [Aspergillus wentii DTO 134E9]